MTNLDFTSFGRTFSCRPAAVVAGTKRADAAHAEKMEDNEGENAEFFQRQYDAEYPAMLGRFVCDEEQKMRDAEVKA